MKGPSFAEGVGFALAAGAIGGIAHVSLAPVLSGESMLRGLVPALGMAYAAYLLTRSRHRVGRVSALAAWFVLAWTAWVMEPPIVYYLLMHVGLIWVTRSLFHHTATLSALLDLGLCAVGLMAGIAAFLYSGSVGLAGWSFFLAQALFSAIPTGSGRPARPVASEARPQDDFERAHGAAKEALRRLPSIH